MSGETSTAGSRRARIRARRMNGVDAVEASDDGLTLTVTFLGKAPHGIGPENIRIDGGRRVTGVRAVETSVEREDDPELDDRLHVTLDKAGDTSRYRLSVVRADPYGRPGTEPYPGFEQRYFGADFTFRPDCPSPFDPAYAGGGVAADFPTAPVIDYTARDYDTIRRLLLDRLALTTPGWVERNPADLGMTLVELLAYTGDRISYQQDAVATEAYLDTARRRVSVRRHVRLIDYAMHDGCNARAFVTVETVGEHMLLPGTFRFAAVSVPAGGAGDPDEVPEPGTVIDDSDLAVLDEYGTVEVFEPVAADEPLVLREAHNTIRLWTWGGEVCALPPGATSATLRDAWADPPHDGHDGHEGHHGHGGHGGHDGHDGDRQDRGGHDDHGRDHGHGQGHDHGHDGHDQGHGHHGHDHAHDHGQPRRRLLSLRAGDVLVLEEVKGARSGTPGDADPAHRQAVRLTSVTPAVDAVEDQPVLEVTWAAEDALRFPLRLATLGGSDCAPVADVSVARGNVVLVDHGRTLGTFPEPGDGDGAAGETGEADAAHRPGRRGPARTVTVPPVPAVVAACGPPAFGCWDPASGEGANAAGHLIGALTGKADSGRLLTADDLRELVGVVGESATARAGLRLELAGLRRAAVVPATAAAQAAALRTLLAQSVYPGIAPRFRPTLDGFPVTQAVPFPLPRRVAAGQAERLAAIPEQVRGRLVELWRSAKDRDGLGDEEIAELAVVFGLKVIERFELRRHPARALRDLLHRSAELLEAKRRRLAVLTARARAGTVLGADIAWEIAHSWGDGYAIGLAPGAPQLRGPASAALTQDPRAALPAVLLRPLGHGPADGAAADTGGDGDGAVWTPRRDLLTSGPRGRHFVGELEDDGRLALRFGDGHDGARPEPGGRLGVYFRVGGGAAGNVGAEAINHLVLHRPAAECEAGAPPPVAGVRNPLPAQGGTEPEPVEQVRQLAPLDLKRTRLRAVTADDYAALASRLPGVQRAAAELRWNGSGHEVHVALDPWKAARAHGAAGTAGAGGGDPSPLLLDAVAQALEPYRRIGHDLVVGPARLVPLDIALTVCAAPGHQHGQILAALYRALGSGRTHGAGGGGRLGSGGGGLGFFHPDALTFGEPVRLSRLVAVAAGVPGVVSVEVTRLRRLFHGDSGDSAVEGGSARDDGLLLIGPLEIATCENDPERPELGRLEISLGGGR